RQRRGGDRRTACAVDRRRSAGAAGCVCRGLPRPAPCARGGAPAIAGQPPARTHAVYGALADKDVAGVIAALGARIAHWHLAGLDGASPRGLAMDALAEVLQQTLPQAKADRHADVASALAAAHAAAQPGERILAFGSFFVAAAVMAER